MHDFHAGSEVPKKVNDEMKLRPELPTEVKGRNTSAYSQC